MRRLLLLFALFGCTAPRVMPADMAMEPEATYQNLLVSNNPKLDVLFLVDNSNSMSAMVDELKNRFPQFLSGFHQLADDGLYADLHIGVITSDYGAGATGAPGCQPSPGGQLGQLQAVGAAAPNVCRSPVGAPYIRYSFGPNGDGPNNLPINQDLDTTFTCMASVGANGCGFEHQLESVWGALHNPDNGGFVRDDARLMIVFLTNEDDCSGPPDSDVYDKNKTAQYGYEDSFRCARFGVRCAGVPIAYASSAGVLMGCEPDPDGILYNVSRYVDLFKLPRSKGGAKENPEDVTLVAFDAPEQPVQVLLSNPGTPGGTPYAQCGQLNEASNPPCVPVLQHSCQAGGFFGDPAVRLNAVINAVAHHKTASICDNDYTGAITGFGVYVAGQMGGCLPWKVQDLDAPGCDVVEDATLDDGSTRTYPVAHCSTADPNAPCFRLEPRDFCAEYSPQGVAVTIDRRGQPAPTKYTARVNCLVLPPS